MRKSILIVSFLIFLTAVIFPLNSNGYDKSSLSADKAKGEEIISFAIGDPDIPTPSPIIDRLCKAAKDPANHRYPESEGLPELRRAIAAWYKQRFDVDLDPDKEVLPASDPENP